MRGKVIHVPVCKSLAGITPAYAGKSYLFNAFHFVFWDHPRICGEKTKKIP